MKDIKVNWKLFGFESEFEYIKCITKCDYMNNDIPINQKKCACPSLEKAENCIIFLTTQKLRIRIEIERGESSPVFMCSRKSGLKLDFGINEDLEGKEIDKWRYEQISIFGGL